MKEKFCTGAIMVCLLMFFSITQGQTQAAKTPKPKIMVIPKIKEGEDLKKMYDSSQNIRVAIAKIEEVFLGKEANLVSFDAKLKQVEQNRRINSTSGNQEDSKSMVLQMSGADVYVEAEVNVVRHSQFNANSVSVILNAYQNGTSNLLGVKEGRSRINATEDIGLLTSLAMDTISVGFLNLMQIKWDDIYKNGQSIYVQFTLGSNVRYDFESELGHPAKMLSELIDDWFQQHTVNGVFNNQGVVGNMMIISDARTPLKNPANPNANYTGQNFYSDISKFIKSLGLQLRREIGTNNKIIITLL